MLRMRHKEHGFCFAHDGNEEKYLRNIGWIGEDESFVGEVGDAHVELIAAPITESLEPAAPPVRRGRKPKEQ